MRRRPLILVGIGVAIVAVATSLVLRAAGGADLVRFVIDAPGCTLTLEGRDPVPEHLELDLSPDSALGRTLEKPPPPENTYIQVDDWTRALFPGAASVDRKYHFTLSMRGELQFVCGDMIVTDTAGKARRLLVLIAAGRTEDPPHRAVIIEVLSSTRDETPEAFLHFESDHKKIEGFERLVHPAQNRIEIRYPLE